MASLPRIAPAVQPDSPRDRPIPDPFAEDFAGYPDEAPELPPGAELAPMGDDEAWWGRAESEALRRLEAGWAP